jgi:hypothetical protein
MSQTINEDRSYIFAVGTPCLSLVVCLLVTGW